MSRMGATRDVLVGQALMSGCLLAVVVLRPTAAASQEAPPPTQIANTGDDC
jgi:hypothetical protein